MGRSMFDYGNQAKEKARQQKQIEKASKRILAKQRKAGAEARTPNTVSDKAEPVPVEEIVKGTA